MEATGNEILAFESIIRKDRVVRGRWHYYFRIRREKLPLPSKNGRATMRLKIRIFFRFLSARASVTTPRAESTHKSHLLTSKKLSWKMFDNKIGFVLKICIDMVLQVLIRRFLIAKLESFHCACFIG